ncbi:MAG: glycosyltransferase family 2 protein [Oligoflexia bacterium]|nr:glycosyltransferase family 2 protein [Oligoflexia bacterium]MBF0364626.1 glycosyltransferase family 2 protein [Oligoflexia bacterium]
MKISCIIPAYGRDISVLEETLKSLFSLGEEFFSNCIEVWVIDQNWPSLALEKLNLFESMEYRKVCGRCESGTGQASRKANSLVLYHVTGIAPSTTIAKNWAITRAQGDLLLFCDDDVSLRPGAIKAHLQWQAASAGGKKMGMLGGREIIFPVDYGRGPLKNGIAKIMGFGKKHVGTVSERSFFLCDFDQDLEGIVPVDTIRGCNASLRKAIWSEVGGFDEAFQRTALREESDLALRIKRAGYQNYYCGSAVAIHRRQVGGCNNLVRSYNTLLSKFECELLFQSKHFGDKSAFYFFLRMLPLTLESLLFSWGFSFVLLMQFTLKFLSIKNANINK